MAGFFSPYKCRPIPEFEWKTIKDAFNKLELSFDPARTGHISSGRFQYKRLITWMISGELVYKQLWGGVWTGFWVSGGPSDVKVLETASGYIFLFRWTNIWTLSVCHTGAFSSSTENSILEIKDRLLKAKNTDGILHSWFPRAAARSTLTHGSTPPFAVQDFSKYRVRRQPR